MQIDSILSGVLSGGSSIPLHQMAARLRPVEETQAVNKLPENDCGNCGVCPSCQAQAAAEASGSAAFGIVDVVELSPAALTEARSGADPEALKRRTEDQPAATYDASGRAISDEGVSGAAAGEVHAQQQGAAKSKASKSGESAKSAESGASEEAESSSATSGVRSYEELSEEEQEQVDELKARDTEVRQHEQAHLAAAGEHAIGAPSFEYQTGPDGNKYAIGGEVQIDTSPIEGDPEATIQKMQTIIAAAQAPAEPSGQDRSVASQARAALAEARAELAEQQQAAFEGGAAGEAEAEDAASVDGAASLSAATVVNPVASAVVASAATATATATASASAAAKSSSSHSNGSQSNNGPQLYNAQGAAAASNDGSGLARELDLVA